MKHVAMNFIRVLCGIAVMFAFVAVIASMPALAASNGIYIATAMPHYRHPITGRIEDAGGDGSSVLGQSMTESAVCKISLVEVDPEGNTYITVRLQLMDNIQDPQFQADGEPVAASLMQEDYTNNTADYRMKVNSENAIIRCNMHVIAMGRDVIFYITVSNLHPGSADFITSVNVEPQKQPDPAETQPPVELPQPTDSQTPVQTDDPKTEAPVQTNLPITDTEPLSSETDKPDTKKPETSPKDEDPTLGLQEFDKDGNKVEQNPKNTNVDMRSFGDSAVVLWVLGCGIVIAAAGGCVWYFCFFKKKK